MQVVDLPTTPTGRLVVLIHGLMATEQCWVGVEEALRGHPGLTAVPVRYDTGRSIADSGLELAELLESTCADWPVPVESIALVGHSMGGLVARRATEAGTTAEHRWMAALTDVVTLGTPHHGAPLEKAAALATGALRVAEVTRPLADFLDTRSSGIKDLRFGTDAPVPAGVQHHFVAGVVTADPKHPFGVVMGDLMVRERSATDDAGPVPANVVVLGGKRHFDLLGDADVIDHLLGWLA